MSETGEVIRETVIDALSKNGVIVTRKSVDDTRKTITYILGNKEFTEEQTFGMYVGRRMLHYLDRRFKVPIHLFYNPAMKPAIVTGKSA